MRVKDMMTQDPQIIGPETTLSEAAQLMRECDCGYLPVGENDRLIGALTDRDIVVRAIAQGCDPETTEARDVMTENILYCFEDDDIDEAGEIMKKKQVRRLLVVNKDKRMTGILSVGDLARRYEEKLVGDIESDICQKAA